VATGDWVRVSSRRGSVDVRVREGGATHRGSVFMAFHFREAAANLLTTDALDPVGKIPEFKYCAVKVEPRAAGKGS
jgi:formate dehydrogenase major subunit